MPDSRILDFRRVLPLVVGFIVGSALIADAADPSAALEASTALDAAALTVTAMAAPIVAALRRRRGRPRKYDAPSRAITLTLPESVLEALTAINPDPSQAIVQLAKRRGTTNGHGRKPAELAVFGKRAVITIRPTASLERRTGVHLVPLPDGRALISFDQPKTIADLELTLLDALDDPKLSAEDRRVFEGIAGILKEARQSSGVSLLRRNIIVLESAQAARRPAPKAVRSNVKRVS